VARRAPGLTRAAIEAGEVVHPLEADGLGRAPFRCWTAIRLPLLALAAADPAVMARRRERVAREAKLLRVPATDRCGRCRLPADDLYVIVDEGDLAEEFYPGEARVGLLAFGDGTVLRVGYDHEGCWRITRKAEGTAAFAKSEATGPDEDYSDEATLAGDLRWVVFGARFERIRVKGAARA
jgi:hypothetical protein